METIMSRSISSLLIAAASLAAVLTVTPASAQNVSAHGTSAGQSAPTSTATPAASQKTPEQKQGTGPSNMGWDLKTSKPL
jgi:hypothetical protein